MRGLYEGEVDIGPVREAPMFVEPDGVFIVVRDDHGAAVACGGVCPLRRDAGRAEADVRRPGRARPRPRPPRSRRARGGGSGLRLPRDRARDGRPPARGARPLRVLGVRAHSVLPAVRLTCAQPVLRKASPTARAAP